MQTNTWRVWVVGLMLMGAGLLLAGCADESGLAPGTAESLRIPPEARHDAARIPWHPQLIGTWDVAPFDAEPLGVDELTYFLRGDSTFLFYQRYSSTELRESGRWWVVRDALYFHELLQDAVPQDTVYARSFRWTDRDTLEIQYLFDQPYTVTYTRRD